MIALPGGIWAYGAWAVVLVTRNEGVRGKEEGRDGGM